MKIRYKLLLIGVGMTLLLMIVASFVGYTIFRKRTMDDLFRAMDASLGEFEYFFSEDEQV